MARYIVNDTNMTATADAIRAKTGSAASITFDVSTGFKTSVEQIATGTDVSDTTATTNTVLGGKYFYNSSGQRVEGNVFIICN